MTKEEQIFLLHRAQAQCEKRLKEVLQRPGGGGAEGGSVGKGRRHRGARGRWEPRRQKQVAPREGGSR